MLSWINKDFSDDDDDGWFVGRSASSSRVNTPTGSRANTPQQSPLFKPVFTKRKPSYVFNDDLAFPLDLLFDNDKREVEQIINENTAKLIFTPTPNGNYNLPKLQKMQVIDKEHSDLSLTFDLAFGIDGGLSSNGIASNKSSYVSEEDKPRLTPEPRI